MDYQKCLETIKKGELLPENDFTRICNDVKAILIGRFQKKSNISREKLEFIVNSIPQLSGLPIIANIDFGHTTPIATLPIGGECEVSSSKIKVVW